MTQTKDSTTGEQAKRIIRRIAHEALALTFGFGITAAVVLTVWTLQGKL